MRFEFTPKSILLRGITNTALVGCMSVAAAIGAEQSNGASHSKSTEAPGASSMSAVGANVLRPSFKVSSGLSHGFQKYTGITWLTNQALSGIVSTALSLKTHGLVKAKVRTYGFTDLLDGEFKSVDIKTNGGTFDGIPFGNFHIATNTPFKLRYLQRKGHQSGMRTPVLFDVEGSMAEHDVSKALNSKAVSESLRFLKLDLPGLGEQRLQVLQPKIDFVGKRVILDSFLITAGANHDTGIPLHVEALPCLEGERRIVLKDMKIESSAILDSPHFSKFADDLLNPLIDFGRMDRFTHAFRLSRLNVGNKRVNYAGRLLLAPKQTSKPTFSAPFIMNSQIAADAAAEKEAAAKAATEKAVAATLGAEKTGAQKSSSAKDTTETP